MGSPRAPSHRAGQEPVPSSPSLHAPHPALGILSCTTLPLSSPRLHLSEVCNGLPHASLRLEEQEDIVGFASCLGEGILKQPSPHLPKPISHTSPLRYHHMLPQLLHLSHLPLQTMAVTCSAQGSELRCYAHHCAAPQAPRHQAVSEDLSTTLPENSGSKSSP